MPLSIAYRIAMPEPASHLFEVEITVSGLKQPACDFVLPTWTPGSYLIREFARHVRDFSAATPTGKALPWKRLDKTTWRVESANSDSVIVRYRVYACELTVQTSHLDTTHAYFNGTTVFMYLDGAKAEPCLLTVVPPSHWEVTTGLDPVPGRPNTFRASNYDHLVDCPVEAGTHRLFLFTVAGKTHRVAIWGRGNEDETRLIADMQRIVETQATMFHGLPYNHYTFIVHLVDKAWGGLEHRNSTSLITPRYTFRPEKEYHRWLGLVSHEFFHVWNVKRILAAVYWPTYDYVNESYTNLLWVHEGLTSYYDELTLCRSGLISPKRYHEHLAESIRKHHEQPGRLVQSAEESSFTTWIKFYRQDANFWNTGISYYQRGSLIGLCLDLEIRRRTANACSLDDVMRYLYSRYYEEGLGLPEGAFQAAVETVAGSSFSDFFARYAAGTEELPFEAALATVGLELTKTYDIPEEERELLSGEAKPETGPLADIGLRLKTEAGRTLIAAIPSTGPAYLSGLSPDDELVAINGFRVDEKSLPVRLRDWQPGDRVVVSVFRRDELLHFPVTLAEKPLDKYQIAPVGEPTDAQKAAYQAWTHQPLPAKS